MFKICIILLVRLAFPFASAMANRGEKRGRHARNAVLLYPGSFSPVQLSHLRAAGIAKRAVESSVHDISVYSVRLSAVSDGYGKKGLWPASDRLELLRLALQGGDYPGVALDTWEADQATYQRTFQVAQHFAEVYKNTNMVDMVMLVGGADLFEGMFAVEATPKIPKPWTPESVGALLQELDGIVVVQRAGSECWAADTILEMLRKKMAGHPTSQKLASGSFVVIVAEASAGDGSSTAVRELISGGLSCIESQASLTELVGQEVSGAIVRRAKHFHSLVSA
eukprot:TRINITY_DN3120_c0_g2_i1.p1 TRINITY_DN3120_c0_g2~~TRINITY_DN3120_c0_g2_i1.p1  ORF type:complete len:281 (+),score=66.03 TRINITY_DN3120_c0_g2_i1:15-857(+)